MRINYLIFLFLISGKLWAQTALPDDTINFQEMVPDNLVLSNAPFSGYIGGSNIYGDQSKAQLFKLNKACIIKSVLVYIGDVKNSSLNDSSKLIINLYQLNGTGTNLNNLPDSCPGDIFYQESFSINQLQDSSLLSLNPVSALYSSDGRFAIGIDLSQLWPGDSVGVYNSLQLVSGNPEFSWEKTSSGQWFSILRNWGMQTDFAFFPVINATVGLTEINNTEIQCYPNPARDLIKIILPDSKLTKVKLSSVKGDLVSELNIGDDGIIDLSNITVGIYHLIIETKDGIFTKKIVVIR